MNRALSTSEIKERSVTGAKWLFVTNALNVPAAFLMAFFLGRTSPEALGAFGLVQVFIAVITTFIVFGGQTVLRNFMAKVTDPTLRGKMLFTYLLIIFGLMILMFSVFSAFPNLLKFFLRQEVDGTAYLLFFLFSFVVIAFELLSSSISGMMNIKISAVAQSVTRLIPLPLLIFFLIFNKSFFNENAWTLILGFYLFSFFLGSLVSLIGLLRENRFNFNAGLYLPKGFYSFCLTTHLATVFSFLYNDADRIFMLHLENMGGLGMYQAVVSITNVIEFTPRILAAALVPTFSSLIAVNNQKALKLAYDTIQRYSVIAIITLSLITISFSRELLGIFGQEYKSYHYILALFGLTAAMCSLFLGNTTILTSYEVNYFRLGVSTLQILIQLVGTFVFISSYGVLAVAGFKAFGRISANMINMLYILKMPLGIEIPRIYLSGVILCAFSFFVKIYFPAIDLILSMFLFFVLLTLFAWAGKITLMDLKALIQIFKAPKLNSD